MIVAHWRLLLVSSCYQFPILASTISLIAIARISSTLGLKAFALVSFILIVGFLFLYTHLTFIYLVMCFFVCVCFVTKVRLRFCICVGLCGIIVFLSFCTRLIKWILRLPPIIKVWFLLKFCMPIGFFVGVAIRIVGCSRVRVVSYSCPSNFEQTQIRSIY